MFHSQFALHAALPSAPFSGIFNIYCAKKVFLGPTLIDKQLRLWAAQSFQFNEWISLGLISCFLGPRSARGGRRRALL